MQLNGSQERIKVPTDLLGRGIDAKRVNIGLGYDMPEDGESYLHRSGRAGCLGTRGLATTSGTWPSERKRRSALR